jgi:hypothetical protein
MADEVLRSEFLQVHIPSGANILTHVSNFLVEEQRRGTAVLRWGLVALQDSIAVLEVCRTRGNTVEEPQDDSDKRVANGPAVALVVPTGVGASIGGFIGDAGAVTRAFELTTDLLITHPNVVNGADLYGGDGAIYVDGYTLDEFFAGSRRLLPTSRTRRIGLLLDQMEPRAITLLINATNATRAVWGLDVVGYAICRSRISSRVSSSAFGHFVGQIENPSVLFEAADRLVHAGAEVIAAVTATSGIPAEHWRAHYGGSSPNPLGALEALISRAITWKLRVPCAHAPAFAPEMFSNNDVVDPRAAAEVISRTGLPCVLRGLARTPHATAHDGISVRDLAAIVVPYDCAGGAPALGSIRFGVPLVAVRANRCSVGVAADKLGVACCTIVQNYAEAIAFTIAARAGVAWDRLCSGLAPLRQL